MPYGDYQFEYYVKDLDGAWSDPFSINLTLDENPKVLTRYEVYYKCNEEVLFTETDEIVLDYGESNTKTFYAKDFSPAYQLISESSVTKTVNSINQVEKIYFQYEINEISPQIDIEIASNKMRDDGSIAAGYGFEVKAMLNNFDTDGIDIKTKWLKEEPYEWIHESIYTINNYYKMQRQSGNVYILEPNPDSSSGLKQIFIPVELSDGLYSGLVIVNNIKKPIYEIDTNGQLVHIRDDYISIQTPFSVKVRGTMYEDFNIVN